MKSKKQVQKRGLKAQQYKDIHKIWTRGLRLFNTLENNEHPSAERLDQQIRELMRAYLKTPVYPGTQIAKEEHAELVEKQRKEKEKAKRQREKEAKLEAKLAKEAREGTLP